MYNIRAHETFSRLRDQNNLEHIFAPRLRLSAKTALDCFRPSRVKKSRFRSYIINTYIVNLFGHTCHLSLRRINCTFSTAYQLRESYPQITPPFLHRRWKKIKSYTLNENAATQRWQNKFR
jgi:hypothetical protein